MQPTPRLSGLDLFKFLAAFVMALIHCGLLMSRGLDISIPHPSNPYILDSYLMLGFFSLCLPALAGSAYRVNLEKYLVDGKLLNFKIQDAVTLCLTLMFFESLKNTLAYSFPMFFGWDVLHFIALSLLIITLLLHYFGMRGLWAFMAFSFLFGVVASRFFAQALSDLMELRKISYVIFVVGLFTVPALVLARGFSLANQVSQSQKPVWMVRVFGILLGLIASTVIYVKYGGLIPFRMITSALPFAAFVHTPQNTGHMWPLFPWFTLVGGAFILSGYVNSFTSRKIMYRFLGASLLCMLIFIVVGFDSYKSLLVNKHYFSPRLFSATPLVMFGLFSFYAVGLTGLTLLAQRYSFYSRIIYNVSRGLLPFYIIHFLLAQYLYKFFGNLLGPEISIYVYPWIVVIITYFCVRSLLKHADRPIRITLRKRA